MLAGVRIALGAFALGYVASLGASIFLGTALKWAVFVWVIGWVAKVEGLDLRSLSVTRPSFGTLGWAIAAMVVTFALMGIYYRFIAPAFGQPAMPTRFNAISGQSMSIVLLVSATAGLAEEMVFRCYAISRLHWLTGNAWIASIIPLAVFVSFHVAGYGWAHAMPVTIGAAVLTLLYWWRRDYWCNALAHFGVDFAAFGLAALASHGAS